MGRSTWQGDDDATPLLRRPTTPKRTWLGSFWDVFDAPQEEQAVLWKLDAVLLTLLSLGYFIKSLDQSNLTSAFISGMKEDMQMNGNELTTLITCFTLGYVIGQVPSNLLLTRVSPRYWIPLLELGWGMCTLATYKVDTIGSLYIIRFLVGVFEAGFYPGAQYILGSFYKPTELGKRAVLFHTAGGMATLFILDSVITLPIAVLGFVFLPALPGQRGSKPTFWLNQSDLNIIDKRLASVNRAPPRPLTVDRLKGFARGWHVYALPVMYILWNNSLGAGNIMGFYLKSFNTVDTGTGIKYTVPQINHYIMPITIIHVVTAWIFAWTSDGLFRGRRYVWVLFTTLLNAAVVLTLANLLLYQHITAHWVLYYLTSVAGGMSGILFTWANEICSGDNEERSLVVALMNDFAYVLQAIAPNLVWKQTDYPKSTIGLNYSFILSVALFFWVLLVIKLHKKDIKQAREDSLGSDTSSLAEVRRMFEASGSEISESGSEEDRRGQLRRD